MNPTDGMAGKQLVQLVDGIDYGGVEIPSPDFVNASGYPAKPTWMVRLMYLMKHLKMKFLHS